MLSRPLIAIDIGTSAIKVVEMAGHSVRKLRAIGLEILPPGAVVDGTIQNQAVVEHALKTLLRKLKITPNGRRAALSLGGSSVVIKKIAVQAKAQDLGEQVYYEAEQHFQADMADIYFDWCELGELPTEPGSRNALIVGARRETVEQYIATIRGAGMRTGVIDCDVFSVHNMFEYNYGASEGLTALVNIGASATQVSLISRGSYIYTRDLPIGGEEYSRQIMESLGVDRDNAETLKVALSQGEAGVPQEVSRVLGTLNEHLVSEVQVTVDFFLQSGDPAAGAGGLRQVYLTGGGSRVLGLDAAMAASLQVPVQIVNPFQRVDVNSRKFEMDYILTQGHLYGVAVGLCMRSMKEAQKAS